MHSPDCQSAAPLHVVLGLQVPSWRHVLYPLVLNMVFACKLKDTYTEARQVLFLGPVVQGVLEGDWAACVRDMQRPHTRLVAARNLVVVRGARSCRFSPLWQAPVTEEHVFRGCMVPLLLPALGAARTTAVAPLCFGIGARMSRRAPVTWLQRTCITC